MIESCTWGRRTRRTGPGRSRRYYQQKWLVTRTHAKRAKKWIWLNWRSYQVEPEKLAQVDSPTKGKGIDAADRTRAPESSQGLSESLTRQNSCLDTKFPAPPRSSQWSHVPVLLGVELLDGNGRAISSDQQGTHLERCMEQG